MKGFTLIETIVYMALLGLIMTGTLLSAYDLIESSQRSTNKTTVQEEGAFVQRKFDWALADMSAAPVISGSGCNQILTVTKTGYANNPIEFELDTNNLIEMREGVVGTFLPITTNNVSATCLQFSAIAAVGSAPPGVTVTAKISGLDFVATFYVHK